MTPEQIQAALAKHMAFAARDRNDVSEDATEHWAYTGDTGKAKWLKVAAAVMALVKPKPLVWVWNGEMHRSKSINGVYRVVKTANKANDKYMVIFLDAECRSYTLGYVDGQEAAQAAAQSHADAVHWSGMVLADMIGWE